MSPMHEVRLACVLRIASALLRFPGRATSSALYFLRFYQRHKGLLDDRSRPTEPVPVSHNHLLNVVTILYSLIDKGHVSVTSLLEGSHTHPPQPPTAGQLHTSSPDKDNAASPQPQQLTQLVQLTQPQLPKPPPAGCFDPFSEQQHDTGGNDLVVHSENQLGAQMSALIQGCPTLVGDDYYAAKAQLLEAEQQLLRLLHWQLVVPHPAPALLHVAAALQAPLQLLTASLAVLNDVTAFTDMLLLEGGAPKEDLEKNGQAQRAQQKSPRTLPGAAPAGDTQTKEAVVAVACLLAASRLLGSPNHILCQSCRHGEVGAETSSPVPASNGVGHDLDAGVIGCGLGVTTCGHWVSVFGLDPVLAQDVAEQLVEQLKQTRLLVQQLHKQTLM